MGVAVNACFTGLLNACNTGTGNTLSGAAAIVNGNISMKTWDDFRMLLWYALAGLILSLFVTKQCDLLFKEDTKT